jgi:hypothetical protein
MFIRSGAVVTTMVLRRANSWTFLFDKNERRSTVAAVFAFSSQSHRCDNRRLRSEDCNDKKSNSDPSLDEGSVQKSSEEQKSRHDKVLHIRNEKWDLHFERLRDFVAKHGHTRVSPEYSPLLQSWVERQKNENRKRQMNHQNHQMTDERLERLNQIGMTWEVYNNRWEMQYGQLLDFYRTHGHTHVSSATNYSLVLWCTKQRRQYKRLLDKSRSPLTPEKICKLNRIGFLWDPLEEKSMTGACDGLSSFLLSELS